MDKMYMLIWWPRTFNFLSRQIKHVCQIISVFMCLLLEPKHHVGQPREAADCIPGHAHTPQHGTMTSVTTWSYCLLLYRDIEVSSNSKWPCLQCCHRRQPLREFPQFFSDECDMYARWLPTFASSRSAFTARKNIMKEWKIWQNFAFISTNLYKIWP